MAQTNLTEVTPMTQATKALSPLSVGRPEPLEKASVDAGIMIYSPGFNVLSSQPRCSSV